MDVTVTNAGRQFHMWHLVCMLLGAILTSALILLSIWQLLLVLVCIGCGVYIGRNVFSEADSRCPDTLLPNLLSSFVRKRKFNQQSDELKLIKKICPVCGNSRCSRHRELNVLALKPWTHLKLPQSVDTALEQFLNLILKEFVYSWYRDISNDEAFVDEIRTNLRFIASVLLRRLQKVDIPKFICEKILNTAMKHLHMCLLAIRNADAMQVGTSRNLEQVVLDYYGDNLHCALHNRRVELDYLRQLTEHAFPFILPPLVLDCRSLCSLLREIVSGALLLPAMDVLADPDKVNNLLLLLLDKSKLSDTTNQPTPIVPILESFSRPLRTRNTNLKLTLSNVLNDQEILCSFMKFMKAEASINVLQFYLSIDEFNGKLLNPELKHQQLVDLHKDLCDLYRLYIDPSSIDCVRLDDDIIAYLKSICDQSPEEVVKLQTTTPLFRAYQLAYDLLENTFMPLFHQSDYYYAMLCGERLPTRLMHSSSRSAARRAGEMLTLSRIGSRLKGVFKTGPVEGRFVTDDVDYDAIESELAMEKRETQLHQPTTSTAQTMEFADDLSLDRAGDGEPIRDLSAWRVTIPRVMSTRDSENRRKQMFVFCIEVRRVDVVEDESERSHWTLDRRYHEFYVLEQKLEEFHGVFEDAKLTSKKTFLPKDLSFFEQQREQFEAYLQKLLTKPVLRGSKLLYSFLTSEQEFTASFLDVNLGYWIACLPALLLVQTDLIFAGKRVKSGALKLRIERGQHLEPFLKSFLASTESSKSKPSKTWSDRDSDTVSISSEKMSNSIYSNNANVEFGSTPLSLTQQFPSSLPSGAVDNLTSVYDSIVYLALHIFRAPIWCIRVLMVVRSFVRDTIDSFLDWYLGNTLDTVLSEHRIVHIIELLRDTLFFDVDPPRTDDDKRTRRDHAFQVLKDFIPAIFVEVIGDQKHCEGTKLLFDFLQQPRLNKQLSYMLLDQVIQELLPELESNTGGSAPPSASLTATNPIEELMQSS